MSSVRWDPISTHLRGLWKDSGESGTQHSAQSLACRKCSQCTGHHESFTPTGTHRQPEHFGLGPASASGNSGFFYMLPSPLHVKAPGPAGSVLDAQHQGQRAPRCQGRCCCAKGGAAECAVQHQGQRAAGLRGKQAQGLRSSAPRTVDG